MQLPGRQLVGWLDGPHNAHVRRTCALPVCARCRQRRCLAGRRALGSHDVSRHLAEGGGDHTDSSLHLGVLDKLLHRHEPALAQARRDLRLDRLRRRVLRRCHLRGGIALHLRFMSARCCSRIARLVHPPPLSIECSLRLLEAALCRVPEQPQTIALRDHR
eukprot:7384360-Prymnesium_polylepis.1